MVLQNLLPFIIGLSVLCTDATFLVNFSQDINTKDWYIVNDGVMGGLSRGYFDTKGSEAARFFGEVSLDNNGGFTSVRKSFPKVLSTENFEKFVLHVKGDGKRYQFRTKPERSSWYSYISYFETSGEWEKLEIPFTEMYPSFRGRRLNQPNFRGHCIEEITFLIGNKTAERFVLEIADITLQ